MCTDASSTENRLDNLRPAMGACRRGNSHFMPLQAKIVGHSDVAYLSHHGVDDRRRLPAAPPDAQLDWLRGSTG